MDIEIIGRENSPEKFAESHGFEFSINLEPIKILAQYFVCQKCDKFFETKYHLERHKIGLGNITEMFMFFRLRLGCCINLYQPKVWNLVYIVV